MSDKEERANKIFNVTLEMLDKLVENGDVYISLSPPFSASFEINRDVLRKQLEDFSIAEEDFNRASRRISSMLLSILANEESDYIKAMIRSKLKGESADKRRKSLQEQISRVKEHLFTEHLKNRYNLKLSSKAPSFTGIDWDTKIKVGDAQLEKINFPYATCRIKFQREFEESPFVILGGRAFDSMQINFTIDDVDYLIRVLGTIKRRLALLEGKNAGAK